ncbi:hypothetical protein LguiB_008220 [Lonicera macranthoides]
MNNSKSIMMRVVVAAVAAVVMLQCASAQTRYVVGDGIGWDIPPNGAAAYTSWASGKPFMVGDILVFNFATNQHDVQQVQQDSFDACTSTNPIGNSITNGPANITLSTAGDHYYICTFGRHCQAGQKLAINVSATPGASPPSTTTPPPPATPSPPSNTPPEAACPPPESSDPPVGGPAVSTTPGAGNSPPDSSSPVVFASFFVMFLGIVVATFL